MTTAPATITRLLAAGRPHLTSDADLIGRFAATRDESAFAELASRHGPMDREIRRPPGRPGSSPGR